MVTLKLYYRAIRLSLSLSLVFNFAHAQDAPSNINDQIKMLDRQFQDQISSANQTLADANSALNRCNSTFQVDANGKANPNLEPVPGKDEKTASILQAMLPALGQLAPALPNILDSLKGANSDANKTKKAALDDYNDEVVRFASKWAAQQVPPNTKEGVANSIGKQTETDPKKITATKSSVRRKAMSICESLKGSAVPTQDNATLILVNQNETNTRALACQQDAMNLADAFGEMSNKLQVAKNASDVSGALTGAAISAATAGFMASKNHDSQVKQSTQQNEIAQGAADNGLAACRADAQGQINIAKRSLAQLQNDRADALRDLALRNAAERNKLKSSNVALNSDGDSLPATNPGSPDGVERSSSNPTEPDAGGGGASAGAGGTPGSGSGGGGAPEWGFGGGGNGNYLGGGLPPQEGGAQFAASGGGGSFGGGFASDSGDGLSLDGANGTSGEEVNRGIASVEGIGDGGLNVLMARMRLRFAYHAADLMQGIDLKSLAQKNMKKDKGPKPTDASLPASQF